MAGAIYLAEGSRSARSWLRRLFRERLAGPGDDRAPKSAKSRLQEWSQRVLRSKPRYELVESVEEHIAAEHPEQVGSYSREQILELAHEH